MNAMNYRKMLGAGIAISIVLSGCGSKPAAATEQPAQTQGAQAQPNANGQAAGNGQSSANGQNGSMRQQGQPGMNEQELKMANVYRSLIMMDKAEGLAIMKDQATAMLPIVQESIAKTELSDDNKAKLLEKLTAEQKKYIDESADRMPGEGFPGGGMNGQNGTGGRGGAAAGGNGQGGGAPGAGNAQGGAAQGGPAQGEGQTQGNGGPRNGNGQGGLPQGNGQGNGGPVRGMNNVGQQLVELLQSKTK
jgi:hypothetical protein